MGSRVLNLYLRSKILYEHWAKLESERLATSKEFTFALQCSDKFCSTIRGPSYGRAPAAAQGLEPTKPHEPQGRSGRPQPAVEFKMSLFVSSPVSIGAPLILRVGSAAPAIAVLLFWSHCSSQSTTALLSGMSFCASLGQGRPPSQLCRLPKAGRRRSESAVRCGPPASSSQQPQLTARTAVQGPWWLRPLLVRMSFPPWV